MGYRLEPLTAASLPGAPPVCVDCVFWQSRGDRPADKARWGERAEESWGAWGVMYRADDDRRIGYLQYGPASLFPRARELPAGPPSDDALLVTCAYLSDPGTPWVMQSLFLFLIGEARDRKVRAIEAFGYRYPEGTSPADRFFVHRTVFPSDFLGDFGFVPLRSEGRVELARLELGQLVLADDPAFDRALRYVRERLLAPAPVPGRR